MPQGGHFFDAIVRQHPIDEEHLNPADNLEEFLPISEEELAHLEREAQRARAAGRAVIGNFGGTSFGDISHVPGVGLPDPKGIRDIAEWYVSTRSRRDYVHAVFHGQCEIARLRRDLYHRSLPSQRERNLGGHGHWHDSPHARCRKDLDECHAA